MSKKFSRRTFITATLSGFGAVTLGSPVESFTISDNFKTEILQGKRLYATTDYADNIIINHRGSRYGIPVNRTPEYYANNECFMNVKQLDDLHKFLASMGVKRHQWIVDIMWTLYEDYPHDFDLLEEAVKSAHKHGLEFYAEIKPWEGGAFGIILPGTMPCPKESGAYHDLRGVFTGMRRFEALHPELSLKRKSGTFESPEPVSAIRLIKRDDSPTRLKAEDLTVYTSATNNRFEPYKGPVTFRETIERRLRFPYWKQCRVLHFENLKIPEGHKYFLVRCSLADENGDFSNEKGNILELVGASGNILPHTLGSGPVRIEDHNDFYQSKLFRKVLPYLQTLEVLTEISDPQKMREHYRDFYSFGDYSLADLITLDKEGYVVATCGKPEYLAGQLHPIYPEVRAYWLNMIRFCLDRGVDGINIRTANHTLSPESWEYGFNEPVLNASHGKTDYVTLSKINGNSYTQFLREAQKLVKSRGKSLTIHLETELIIPDDRGKPSSLPFNFEWQWETWVKEIADELEIRGTYGFRPWNFAKALDMYCSTAKAANKPIFLQGDFHGMSFNGPFDCTEEEIKIVNNREDMTGYVFYETANITRLNNNGKLEGSPDVVKVLDKLRTFVLPERGLCAHRGAMKSHPENTIAAFRAAIDAGAHMIEFDVQPTKDGKMVVIHDGTVDRTTNGKGKVSDLALSEIKKLDAGSWKAPEFANERIPTLQEVLSIMPYNVWLNIHVKGEGKFPEQVARLILKQGRMHQAFLACTAKIALQAKEAVPGIMICNMERQDDGQAYVSTTISARNEFIQLRRMNNPQFANLVKQLKTNGILVNYYGTDSPDEIKMLFETGVDFPLVNDIAGSMEVARQLNIQPVQPIFKIKN